MPLSKRSVHCETILGELLIGIALLAAAPAARAGGGTIGANDINQGHYDEAKERSKLFFGDEDSPDPVLMRADGAFGDRVNRFDDPENEKQLEEVLDGLEQALNRGVNEGRWVPFRHRDRKAGDPKVLFGLDAPTIQEPVAAANETWKDRFHFKLSRGLEYRQQWPTARKGGIEMRISGPVVNDGLGLGFRLEGQLFELPFQLKAYGGTVYDGFGDTEVETGIQFDLKF
jgi:hypothetical protein